MGIWVEKFINVNQFSRPGKKLDGVKKIVVHYTANPGASAQNHYLYFGSLKDRYASAHLFVDKIEAINIIPLNEVAYHAGDIQKRNANGTPYRGVKELLPSANYLSIGVEMCIEKDGTFHPDTITRTEDVFVELCKKFNLDPMCDIVRHFDVTAKNCPAPWVKDEQQFTQFKQRVNAKLNPPKPVAPAQPVEPKEVIPPYVPTNNGVLAKVKVLVDGLNIRVAPDTRAAITRKAKKDEVFNVFANVNDWHNVGQANWIFGNNGEYLSLVKEEYPGYPVKKGSTNTIAIKLIQAKVGVTADGVWGNLTDEAVSKWQKEHGLVADCIIGPKTWGVMF